LYKSPAYIREDPVQHLSSCYSGMDKWMDRC